MQRHIGAIILVFNLLGGITAGACDALAVDTGVGVDFYNRYVWRGSDIGNSPSIQPALTLSSCGFDITAWGAYSVSPQSSDRDEIDFILGYSRSFGSEAAIRLVLTDYYYPNGGVRFSKDDAHTLETGLLITGPRGFPMTLSAYVNVANDPGHNTYFQLDYPATAGEVALDFWVGLAGGSKEEPGYYGTNDPNLINVGVSARREIAMTAQFTLPLTGMLIYNPLTEISYLVVGLSL